MLKLQVLACNFGQLAAAFRRLCVETSLPPLKLSLTVQPPSGGCVLKQKLFIRSKEI